MEFLFVASLAVALASLGFGYLVAPHIRSRVVKQGDRAFKTVVDRHGVKAAAPYFLLDNDLGIPIGVFVIEKASLCLYRSKEQEFTRLQFADIDEVVFPHDVVSGDLCIILKNAGVMQFKLNQDMSLGTLSPISAALNVLQRDHFGQMTNIIANLQTTHKRLSTLLRELGVHTRVAEAAEN